MAAFEWSEAEHRGHVIHWLRLYYRFRHDGHPNRARIRRTSVRQALLRLRDMGHGPVELPELSRGGHLLGPSGVVDTWWPMSAAPKGPPQDQESER